MNPDPMSPPLDGVSTVALLVLLAFVIERVVSGVLFFMGSIGALSDPAAAENTAARVRAERIQQWWRFFFAGLLTAGVLVVWDDLGVLRFFGQGHAGLPRWIDPAITWVVLLGGADRIAALVKLPGAGAPPVTAPPPLQVTGTLKLDDSRRTD